MWMWKSFEFFADVLCFCVCSQNEDDEEAVSNSTSVSRPPVAVTNPNPNPPCPWKCELTNEAGYVVYSALGSFYIPMFVMLFFYWRIYKAAVRTTRAINQGFRTTKGAKGLSVTIAARYALLLPDVLACLRWHHLLFVSPPLIPWTTFFLIVHFSFLTHENSIVIMNF